MLSVAHLIVLSHIIFWFFFVTALSTLLFCVLSSSLMFLVCLTCMRILRFILNIIPGIFIWSWLYL